MNWCSIWSERKLVTLRFNMIVTLSIKALTLAKGDSGNIGSDLLNANSFMKMAIWLLSGIRQSGGLISFYHLDHLFSLRLSPVILIHLVTCVLLLQRIIAYRYYKIKVIKRWLTARQVKIQELLLKPKR